MIFYKCLKDKAMNIEINQYSYLSPKNNNKQKKPFQTPTLEWFLCKRQIGPILKERSLCEIIEPQGGRIFMPGTSKVDWMHMFEEQESSNLSISQY